MSKQLRIWLFVLLSTLLTSTTLPAEGVITMTTSKKVGEIIWMRLESNDDECSTIGLVRVDGRIGFYDPKPYEITSQTITIRGDVTLLDCRECQLTSLDVSKNTALKWLRCGDNQLTSLDVSKNTALILLDCSRNQLTSFDVSKNTALQTLRCSDIQLTSLDLSKHSALDWLECNDNQLTSLDVSKNRDLKRLSCSENNINGEAMTKLVKSLPDIPRYSKGGNFYVANYFDDKNRCSFRDVAIARSKNWDVQKYRPDGGFTKYSGVGDGIITITTTSAVGKGIMLEVKANGDVAIEGVQEYEEKDDYRYTFYRKRLTSQTITIRGDITDLSCAIDSLTSLDVSGCPSLTKLNCHRSQLTSLNLSQNPALTELDCSENKLTSLDLSQTPALTKLDCSENKLTSLDLSPCPNLKSLKCYLNRIRGKAMTQLVESLPNRSRMETSKFYLVCYSEDDYEENLCYRSDVECASNKNWTPQKGERTYDKKVVIWRYRWEDYFGVKDEGVVKMRTAQKVGSKITLTLEAEGNVAIDGVKGVPETDGKPHQYTLLSQDVTIHGYVTKLDCSGNKLTSLDLTTTAPLVELNCSNNQLTALDVSQNAALTSLACYRNQIKGEAMAQLIKGLPQLQLEDAHLFGIVSNASDEGNVFLKADVERVRDKGWSPMRWNEERQQYEPYAGKETETFAVTLTKEGEGTLSATGADDLKAVLYDTELTIEATPATGYELTALTANGTDILATKKVTIKEAVEVKATFTKKSFAVKLTKEGEGTITATGADDLTAVPYGTELTIVATPTEGYELISLTAGEEDILATKKVIVTDNVTVKATFDEATFAVSLKKEGEGTISATGAEDLNAVAYGTELTIVATPAEGYELTALTANGTDILATKKIVVKENMTIKATFVDHTGVETTVTQQIQLYPNPTTDYVIVEGVAPASEVTLHSMTGERLYAGRADSRGTLQIDLTPYADGVYLVCVAGDTYRVVVRH